MAIELPDSGFIFWPVGTGDSSTIVIDEEDVFQIDLHHMEKSEDSDEDSYPVVDHLVESLPKRNGKPYLAAFALTHPDEDHIKGFKELLERVTIGELWFTPRVFREFKKDLHEDAIAFKDEAKRRVKETIDKKGKVNSSDLVRIIGFDDLLKEEQYSGFPIDKLTIPGNYIAELDGRNVEKNFIAFIHAPFKEDSAGDRNETSLAMQITLIGNKSSANALFFGDLSYPTIRKIFDITKESGNVDTLGWNIFLSPHHCSKSVMYTKEDDKEVLKQDILDDIDKAALSPGYIVASSCPIPTSNKSGDNPPHAIAKKQYERIVPDDFLCAHENPEGSTKLIIFSLADEGLVFLDQNKKSSASSSLGLKEAIDSARGTNEPPKTRVGFGKCH